MARDRFRTADDHVVRFDNGAKVLVLDPFEIEGDPNAPVEADSFIRSVQNADVSPELQAELDQHARVARARITEARDAAENRARREAFGTFGAHAVNQLASGFGSNAAALVPAIEDAIETDQPFFTTADDNIAGQVRGERLGTFRKHQRAIQRDLDVMAAEHPEAATLGQVTGGVTQAFVLPSPFGRADTVIGNAARAGANGAMLGAASAAGNSRQEGLAAIPDALRGAAVGGAIGAVVPLARGRETALGRMAATTGAGAGIGGLVANEASDAEPWSADRAVDVGLGALGGAGLGLIGSGASELSRLRGMSPERLTALADDLDEAAAPYRVRSAGARTLPMQRLVDDLPGGAEAAAKTLADTGIMPRGTLFDTVDDAAERAADVRRSAGSAIGQTRNAMDALTPDDVRGMPVLERQPGMVDPEPLAQAYDDIANQYRGVSGAEQMREAAESLAAEVRRNGPMTYQQAQQQKEFLDSMINWRDPAIGQRLAPIQANRQEVRRALLGSMNDAVATDLGQEAADAGAQSRRNYQVAKLFDDMAHDSELRDAANRVASPSDQMAFALGMEQGGGIRGMAYSLANRAFRGREAAMAAGVMERMADRARARATTLGAAAAAPRAASVFDRLSMFRPMAGQLVAPEIASVLGRRPVPSMASVAAAQSDVDAPDDYPGLDDVPTDGAVEVPGDDDDYPGLD